jgi:hypothetical protein
MIIMYKIHKFLSGLGLIKGTAEVAGSGDGVLLFHSAHLHTHVTGFNDDHYAERVERLLDTLLDL